MKVKVWNADQSKYLGVGEMHREDLKIVDDNDETKVICTLPDHPHIRMENGDILAGCECWWTEDDPDFDEEADKLFDKMKGSINDWEMKGYRRK
jgi:hypothetical protein